MNSWVECRHCKADIAPKQVRYTCGDCARSPFCSQRCRFMDYEIGDHRLERCGGHAADDSTFGVHFGPTPHHLCVPYQAVPALNAYTVEGDEENSFFDIAHVTFDQAMKSFEHAVLAPSYSCTKAAMHVPIEIAEMAKGGPLRFQVPRLNNGVYVLLGEDNYESVHEAVGLRPAFRFVGGAHWAVPRSALDLIVFARDLGTVLGDIHFRQCCDASGFSVVGASTVNDDSRVRLFVQCDPEMTRMLDFDRIGKPDAEIVDRLAFVLGRLAYTPRPRQEQLFKAFASGYKASAATVKLDLYAETVLMRMHVYTE